METLPRGILHAKTNSAKQHPFFLPNPCAPPVTVIKIPDFYFFVA
jgi:hypothetical protein